MRPNHPFFHICILYMKNTKKNYRNYNNQTKKGGIFTYEDIKDCVEIYEKYKTVENYNDLEKIEDELTKKVLSNTNKQGEDSSQRDESKICTINENIFNLFDSKIQKNIEKTKKKIDHYNSIVLIQSKIVEKILKNVEKYLQLVNIEQICKEINEKEDVKLISRVNMNTNEENAKVIPTGEVRYKLEDHELKYLFKEITNIIIDVIIVFIQNYEINNKTIQSIVLNHEDITEEEFKRIRDDSLYVTPEKVNSFMDTLMDALLQSLNKKNICKNVELHEIQKHISENRESMINHVKTIWNYASKKQEFSKEKLYKLLFFNNANPLDNQDVNECFNSKYLDYNKGLLIFNETDLDKRLLTYFINIDDKSNIETLFVNFNNNDILKAVNKNIYFLSQHENKPNKFSNYIHNILEEIENYKYDYYLNEPGKYNLIYFNLQQMIDDMSCYDNILKLKSSLLMNTLTIKLIININKEIIKLFFINILNICVSFKSLSLSETEYVKMEESKGDITYRTKLYFIMKEVTKIYGFIEKGILSDIEYDKLIYFIENFKKRKMSDEEIELFWKITEEEYKPKLFDIEEREFWNEETIELFNLAKDIVIDIIPFSKTFEKAIEISTILIEMAFKWKQYDSFFKTTSIYNDVWIQDTSKEKMKIQKKFELNIGMYIHKLNKIQHGSSQSIYDENVKYYNNEIEKDEQTKYFIRDSTIQCHIDIVIDMLEKLNHYINEHVNKYYFLLEICNFIGKKCQDKNIRKHDFGYKYTKEYASEVNSELEANNDIYIKIINLINKLKQLITEKTETAIFQSINGLKLRDIKENINKESNNLMSMVELLPHRKRIDNMEKYKNINTFYNVITNLTSETKTEIDDINVESHADLDKLFNKYLYTEDVDEDGINDVEDLMDDENTNFVMTTKSENSILINKNKISENSKYLNRVFVLGYTLYTIYIKHDSSENPTAEKLIEQHNFKLSNFIYYLYKLYIINRGNKECHPYNIIKTNFFIVLENKKRAKDFFQWFTYYNKDIFITVVNRLCSVTKDIHDFNIEYPNASDNLNDKTDNPLSEEEEKGIIKREKYSETAAEKLVNYLSESKGNPIFHEKIKDFIIHLKDVYNTYTEQGKLIGEDIVEKYIGDIYEDEEKDKNSEITIKEEDDDILSDLKEDLTELFKKDVSKLYPILCKYVPSDRSCIEKREVDSTPDGKQPNKRRRVATQGGKKITKKEKNAKIQKKRKTRKLENRT